MLIAVSCDVVLARLFGTRHTLYACNAVSMHAQHELLYVDERHLWLTFQENRGICSQNHDAKLTRSFLRVGRGWFVRLLSLLPRLSWEGKESLVTTACACVKISVFYPRTIRGLVDHVTVYYAYASAVQPSQARKLLRHNKTVIRRAKNQRMLELPY